MWCGLMELLYDVTVVTTDDTSVLVEDANDMMVWEDSCT